MPLRREEGGSAGTLLSRSRERGRGGSAGTLLFEILRKGKSPYASEKGKRGSAGTFLSRSAKREEEVEGGGVRAINPGRQQTV
jgi:hypothetical protein